MVTKIKKMLISNNAFRFLLTHVDREMRDLLANELNNEGTDITGAQSHILGILYKEDGLRQKDFLKYTKRSQVAVVYLIDALEEHDLVTRIPDRDDQRSKRVYLTRKGRKMGNTLAMVEAKIEQKILKDIPLEEVEVARRVLKNILKNIYE